MTDCVRWFWSALLANEDALVSSTAAVSLALVGLYSAVGGGWEQALPEHAPR